MFTTTPEGFRINYYINKIKGKPFIVFLHGLAGNHSEFFHQINFFKEKYSILAIDLLGHGKSSKPKESLHYSLQSMSSMVIELLKKENIKNPILAGFSMGGFIACNLSEKIKAKKIILINPFFGKKSITPFFFFSYFFSQFVPDFILNPFVKSKKMFEYNGLLDEYAKMLLQTPRHVHRNIVKNSFNSNILKLRQKAYIIKSKNDEVLNNYIPLNNYELFKVKGFHLAHVQSHDDVNKIIGKIIN